MTTLSFRSADLADKQTALCGLLALPLVSPWVDPALYSLITRHERDLEVWVARLGYRLVRIDRCIRLRRPPLGEAALPSGPTPPRRPLVLALVTAAALEDQRDDSITLQELSDAVRRGTAAHGLVPFDPAQRSQRVDLLAAVRLLTRHGVLEQRTHRADLLENWEREGAGIGAGYVVHRDALVLLADTRDAERALHPEAAPPDSRGARLLRALVETQALRPLELDDSDRTYLVGQRRRLISQAEEMTGGVVEVRSDSLILVLPSDKGLPPDLIVPFPEVNAVDWVALWLLDRAIASSDPDVVPGRRRCDNATIQGLALRLHADHGSRLTVALREGPEALRTAAERRLTNSGLLTTASDGAWVLPPESARYRDADLSAAEQPGPAPQLFEAVKTPSTPLTPTTLFEEHP